MADVTESSAQPKALNRRGASAQGRKNGQGAVEPIDASMLVSKEGTTIIHTEVVAKIAGMAVQEVAGVHELVPFDAGQSVSRLASRVLGQSMRELGINVEVGKTEAAVDVRIISEYGASIVDISAEIRRNVRQRVEAMTGLTCVEVNIEVVDLFFQDDSSSQGGEEPRQQRVK